MSPRAGAEEAEPRERRGGLQGAAGTAGEAHPAQARGTPNGGVVPDRPGRDAKRPRCRISAAVVARPRPFIYISEYLCSPGLSRVASQREAVWSHAK